MTTPTHRCVNCKREWQETQLEVWQGFPVQQRCPECKSACAKMDPVPTTPPEDEKRWAELAAATLADAQRIALICTAGHFSETERKAYSARCRKSAPFLAEAVQSLITRLAAEREGGR